MLFNITVLFITQSLLQNLKYKSIKIKALPILLLLTVNVLTGFSQHENPNFTFIKKISLPGSPRWDYLTMDDDRLFVSNFDRVHVIDLKTDRLITTISDLKGVHGITLAKDLSKGYISNGTDSTVTVFDYNMLKVLKTIQITGKKADAILYNKVSKKVFVYCNGSNHAVAIDAKTDEVIKNIIIGDAPKFAVINGKGSIFNNLEDSNEIVRIDTKH